MLAICIPSMLYFTYIHHHCPHASYMYTQHALLYFYSSPLPSCQLYLYLECSTLLLFITTTLMLGICIPSMLYFTSIHHHCPHASYMYTQHALLYFYSSPLPSCQLYVYLACSTLILFITTALMLALCIPSMLYFTSIHHHCPHASYMYTYHALLYFYSSPLPSCQLYVYLACSTFTSIHHHCPHASYMYTQHALIYFYSSPLPSCQLYVYLACSTLLLFIITALMLAICIPSMLYFTSIYHHCLMLAICIPSMFLLLLLFITTALMLAICIPSMLYFTSIHHHCPHASYMYTQHALPYFYSSSLPSCQLFVYLACSNLLLFITTALMLAICIPSMLYFTSIHHHCPHSSYMYTQHALLYFYSSPLPSCLLYVYLACSTLLLFITTALMLAICIPSMLYFTSIHHHCPHASYMYTQHALLYFYSSPLPHACYMYTQHALLYFYSSALPSCQLYVYLACFYFTSIHHHCPHASYMYTQHALLYFYSSSLPSCQLYVYLACSTLLLFIITALMLAYVYLACSTLLLLITTALMLAICIPSMLYFTSIHHHCPHASYMYTQHALPYFLFIITALMLAICIPSML